MITYALRSMDRAKRETQARKEAAKIKPGQMPKGETVAVRPKPNAKQVRTANAFVQPTKSNGALDLRHANKKMPEGGRFLDMTHLVLGHYARWPNKWVLDLAAIYTALTHFTDEEGKPVFNAIPHWLVVGPHGSGKTRSAKVMRAMMREPTGIAVRYTMPGVRNALNSHKVPILDELQRYFVTGRGYQDLQAIIAGSYSDDSTTLDGQGNGPNDRDAYGPMVLMGQPRLLTHTGDSLDDLLERSIVVPWEKSFDEIPELDDEFAEITQGIKNLLSVWGASERPIPSQQNKKPKLWPIPSPYIEGTGYLYETVPSVLQARAAEISKAPLAVADRAVRPQVVEENGHDIRWSLRAREAIVQVLRGHGNDPSSLADDLEARLKAMGLNIAA